MRRALQHMLERQSGRILVTSSVEGKLGKPGLSNYVVAKHAINGLVKSAAAAGLVDEEAIVKENLLAMRRAGSDIIITYHGRDALKKGWIQS